MLPTYEQSQRRGVLDMFDAYVARRYISKFSSAKNRGIAFELSFAEFKRLMTAKRCHYTGISMTSVKDNTPVFSDRTLERIDSSEGYTKQNTVVCCHGMNSLKNKCIEQGQMTPKQLVKAANKIEKYLSECDKRHKKVD